MIDLHIHTISSDGTDTVSNILKKANKLNIEALSITDHNSVAAYLNKHYNKHAINAYSNTIYNRFINKINELDFKCSLKPVKNYEFNTEFVEKRIYQDLISGGSDYHGTNKLNHNLGVGNNNLSIDKKILSAWKIKRT